MCEASLKPIIDRLEKLFSIFNEHYYNGELQVPVITVSPDTRGAYGWCTGWKAWSESGEPNENDGFYEINICAEYLARPFEEICGTLLHEMAHLYDIQNEVKDCSRVGTYHNKFYKAAAENHGLTVKHDNKYGWAITTLNEESARFIAGLDEKSFELYRSALPKIAKGSRQSSRKYVCPVCGNIVRATKKVNIACMDCTVLMVQAA